MKNMLTMQSQKQMRLRLLPKILLGFLLCIMTFPVLAQEEGEEQAAPVTNRPVKSTFESTMIMDDQTVMVPIKNTFQFDIQHRFGVLKNYKKDAWGLYETSNIRMGFSYTPIDNLSVGVGFTKFKRYADFSAKYALLKQRKSWTMPVSVTYFVNMGIKHDFKYYYDDYDRFSFFHQVLIARKFNDKFSLQIAPSLTHFNLQENRALKNDHFAIAVSAQYKVTPVMSIILNVDQPLSKYRIYAEADTELGLAADTRPNPNPNVSLGLQLSTSSHAFQIFLGNYNLIVPQENSMYYRYGQDPNPNGDPNRKDLTYEDGSLSEFFGDKGFFDRIGSRFRLGFNVTRLWNY
ncbi:MAG: DUF5777 family beta-barrel protein [Saprospiraceae bacterium]|nr:DUF5777 family beta-barrel protein [Saprospiraceae bacterium]